MWRQWSGMVWQNVTVSVAVYGPCLYWKNLFPDEKSYSTKRNAKPQLNFDLGSARLVSRGWLSAPVVSDASVLGPDWVPRFDEASVDIAIKLVRTRRVRRGTANEGFSLDQDQGSTVSAAARGSATLRAPNAVRAGRPPPRKDDQFTAPD
ncbi:hypothetical protein C8J57DRAFT_1221154 [Mycena rebaudengoi]|nr:hypothetical protein C8J57DRAFT_1221154 [Mycena rebaudengoi]